MNSSDLIIKRRHLPHWVLKDSYYFVTFRTSHGTLKHKERAILYKHLLDGHGKYYLLVGFVIMPDHIHIVLKPQHGYSLTDIMKGIKGASARKINQIRNRSGSLWQAESFDRIIRDDEELIEKLNYILMNPLKMKLTNDPWKYPFTYFSEISLEK